MSFSSRWLAEYETEDGDGEEHLGVHIEYSDLYSAMIFLTAIYIAGVFASRFLGMPALVGEILTGIMLGPNFANIVPIPEAFVLLGEIGLILLVLEAGIDIDLTTLKLIGTRGVIIALIGTFLPIALACSIAHLLGYRGIEAVAAGCTFAPTSLGIAMNILRRANIVNTPVGQLIVAAAIIDDMIALVILSQLQAFAGDGGVTVGQIFIPVASAIGFLVIGGYIAVFILPKVLDRLILGRIGESGPVSREWTAMAIMFLLLLALIPATKYGKASPLMGAFLAGLVFCSDSGVHHMFVSQFKRVMQWLLRIFFAASIGFQVPIQEFGSASVLFQGLAFSLALLGKVGVGFLVPNFSFTKRFTSMHLRDCLVVGFSMAAEGEFAFVIAVFAVSNNMITHDLYASVVLAVLMSTMIAPFLLRMTISHFNRKIEKDIYVATAGGDYDDSLEKGIREKTAMFWCIQTKSSPSWGLHTSIMKTLSELTLEVIDHRSWHPRGQDTLFTEVYARDIEAPPLGLYDVNAATHVEQRKSEIKQALAGAINQPTALIKAHRWMPNVPDEAFDDDEQSVEEHVVLATGFALEESMRFSGLFVDSDSDDSYFMMEDKQKQAEAPQPQLAQAQPHPQPSKNKKKRRFIRRIRHLDGRAGGRLEGLFRHDREEEEDRSVQTFASADGIELLDVHGIGTGHMVVREKYDVHGASIG